MLSRVFRFLPDFRGKRRSAKILLKKKLNSAKDIIVRGKFETIYLLPNIKEIVGFEIFINGIYELDSHQLLNSLIPKNGYLLDIGGNIGAITIPLCKKRPDISALAIEAAPWIFSYLEENIKSNKLKNVSLINCAMYDKDGIEMDFFSPLDYYGKGSLASVYTDKSVKVRSRTIDAIVEEFQLIKIDVIKADVEGFEYFVFKGGTKLLSSAAAPVIYFEFADWAEDLANGAKAGDAQQLLLDFGYKLYEITNGSSRVRITKPLLKGSAMILAIKERF